MAGTYPNKSKSFPIWRPWLQVSEELEPGPVNSHLLSPKKKRGSQVCLPGEGAVLEEEGGGWKRRKGSLTRETGISFKWSWQA